MRTRDELNRALRMSSTGEIISLTQEELSSLLFKANAPIPVTHKVTREPADLLEEADPTGLSANTPGAKLDKGKSLPWLMFSGFSSALDQVAFVTTRGAEKYTPNGWKSVTNGEERYMEAFGRHMVALAKGELIDSDTGAYHKAQMIWNLLASLELELIEPSASDQVKPEGL